MEVEIRKRSLVEVLVGTDEDDKGTEESMAEINSKGGQPIFHLVCPPLKIYASEFIRFDALGLVIMSRKDACLISVFNNC